MDFESRSVSMEILDPARGFQSARLEVEQRWDPLTGQGCRLLPPLNLFPPAEEEVIDALTRAAAGCPFCPERVEVVTPKFPEAVIGAGRLRRGEALLFPNLHPYARYSSVAVFSPRRHLLPLTEMNPRLVGDNLATQVAFARAVTGYEPEAPWVSVNANHLPPSGSSVLHPHTQGTVHPFPTTMQRLLSELPADRLTDYIATERAEGRRYLGSTGTVDWVVSFAPSGPAELRAVLSEVCSPEQLDEERVAELAYGIATALTFYAELGFSSYNMALYGTPSDEPGSGAAGRAMLLRMVCRSNPRPWYRSDVMWLERLHGDAAVDIWPEDVADRAGDRFRR
jgi:UDPglucose--hexose-1-phosphate uridylyltransferase